MPKNGDVTTKEGNRFVYRNGRWIKETEIKEGNRFKFDGKTGQYRKAAPEAPAKPPQRTSATSTPARASRPAPAPSRTASRSASAPAAPRPASDAGMKNQDKNYKGSYVRDTLRELREMRPGTANKIKAAGTQAAGKTTSPGNFTTAADYAPKTKVSAPEKSDATNQTAAAFGAEKRLAGTKSRISRAEEEAKRLIQEKNAKRDARYRRKPGTY